MKTSKEATQKAETEEEWLAPLRSKFGQELRSMRESLNMTPEEAGATVNLSGAAWLRLEGGDPDQMDPLCASVKRAQRSRR